MCNFKQKMTDLRNRLVDRKGISVEEAQRLFASAFSQTSRSSEDIKEYRGGDRFYKPFRDEVSPVLNFLKAIDLREGKLRFAFDSSVPDACLIRDDNCRGIEVTQAMGAEQAAIRKTMNESSSAPGFIGNQDSDFSNHYPITERRMYSTKDAYAAIKEGICHRLYAKSDEKFSGMLLLVTAPLNALPEGHWNSLRGEVSAKIQETWFDLVAVLDQERVQKPIFLKGRLEEI